jgi:type I restriction enzyme R subunit
MLTPNNITAGADFEIKMEAHLLAHGYTWLANSNYDVTRAFFPQEVLDFIKETQSKEWEKLRKLLGPRLEIQILDDLTQWLDQHGCLATLRHGFKCYGRMLRVAWFRPAHQLNPELTQHYNANRLGLTRQLHYSPRNTSNSADVVLSVNGLPVVTLELKNLFASQNAESTLHQYRHARDPRETLFEFKRRTLVHFAVDNDVVWLTTRLAGEATHFLPFNKGYEGGAGNPPDPTGGLLRTAFLWEDVLERHSLLELLARFLHLQIDEKRGEDGRRARREILVFPRYHQLRAIRQLLTVAQAEVAGHNYLIEHSAGSGKSNTIAWLAHRLVSLHDVSGERPIFNGVIVVTDRTVLDRQLQDTIYQFEHQQGVVQKIDDDSAQLAAALQSGVPIIITTIQKFPFVTRHLVRANEEAIATLEPSRPMRKRRTIHKVLPTATGALPTKRYAILIDEAHSSQNGDAAAELKGVLAGADLKVEARRQANEEGAEDLIAMYEQMAYRGQQSNLSFFAFTATPKHRTLAVFGRHGLPFDRYPMRQAIEEGFILDVLKSYTTYAAYFKLLKSSEQDPSFDRRRSVRALTRHMRLHPHGFAQKTTIIIEHFHATTRHRIGGQAKAMVVTGSRLEAVRYKQHFDAYIKEHGYPMKTLVAFSGSVSDEKSPDVNYTEVGMNEGLPEKEVPEAFDSEEYQVLIVAEKYQTGFDQPLLHTMFVDRRLSGIQAVQTLSRLNRIHPLKEDTFVLDFVNDRKEIHDAFADYYEGAKVGEEAEPSRLYFLKAIIDEPSIYRLDDVTEFTRVFYQGVSRLHPAAHRTLNALLDPAVERFQIMLKARQEEAELWRRNLQAYLNLYAFLSQIIPFQDSDLERLYTFLRYLVLKLPKRPSEPLYSFDEDVRLQYYRLQKISEGAIVMKDYRGRALDGPTETGTRSAVEEPVVLSRLINLLNERFGTEFTDADQLFFDQIVEVAFVHESLTQAAQANPQEKFALVFASMLETLFIERMDQNVDIFSRFVADSKFRKLISSWMAEEVYSKLQARQVNTSTQLPTVLQQA